MSDPGLLCGTPSDEGTDSVTESQRGQRIQTGGVPQSIQDQRRDIADDSLLDAWRACTCGT